MKAECNKTLVHALEKSCLLAHLQPVISDCPFDLIKNHNNHFFEVEK